LLLEALSFIVDLHRDDTLLEFLQVRRILEPAAAAMAAERVTDEESEGHRRRRAMAGLGTVSGMDTVSIRDLAVSAVIGVHDWERDITQTLVFSVDMGADVRKPAGTDNLADALDYSAVASTIAAVVREGKFHLIETAAERVAERLLADFALTWLRLEVRKPVTADAYSAVITIERTSENR
jgi:7,8-dihydroneopterin aldolase/epimerase/oxygenase